MFYTFTLYLISEYMESFRVKFFVFIAFITVLSSCISKNKIDKNTISVSILPQKKIVEDLLGDDTKVNVMVTKGSSPATYNPTPQQMQLINESSLYIKIGHIGFEDTWINKLEQINPGMKVKDSSKGIKWITHSNNHHSSEHHDHVHNGIDPHIWTSPKTMIQVVKNIENILLKQFPEKSDTIQSNAKTLLQNLSRTDSLYTATLSGYKNKKFLIFHPAYTYLAKDYGLEQISIENEGKEPGVKWLTETISLAKKENIKGILIQEEFNQKSAELIAKEIHIPIIKVNPLSEDFLQEMNELLNKFKKILE